MTLTSAGFAYMYYIAEVNVECNLLSHLLAPGIGLAGFLVSSRNQNLPPWIFRISSFVHPAHTCSINKVIWYCLKSLSLRTSLALVLQSIHPALKHSNNSNYP